MVILVYFLFTAILMNRQLFITHVPQVLMAFDYILLTRTCMVACCNLAIRCSNDRKAGVLGWGYLHCVPCLRHRFARSFDVGRGNRALVHSQINLFLLLNIQNWLVVWNIWIIFPYIGIFIIPTDELICFKMFKNNLAQFRTTKQFFANPAGRIFIEVVATRSSFSWIWSG